MILCPGLEVVCAIAHSESIGENEGRSRARERFAKSNERLALNCICFRCKWSVAKGNRETTTGSLLISCAESALTI